jgi:monovalent cation:H+ antiporter, CPA1 family
VTGEATVGAVELFVALIGAAVVVALVARRIQLPYSVALVLFGLGVAAIAPAHQFEITPQLVLAVLLPGLIFEASYQLDLIELRRTFVSVVLLAVPGVVISTAIVAVVLSAAAGIPSGVAFVVGAMVSATDPAAVIATFKQLRSPRRLATVVEAESLFNDGTAIVVFGIALQAMSSPVSPLEATLSFLAVVLGSSLIGGVVGGVAAQIIARVDDHLIELAISLLTAYGTYLLADRVHQSGIIATVVAGIVLGTYGRRLGLSPRTLEALDTVWEFIAFLLTALVFLLVGFAITLPGLAAALVPITWGLVAVLAARALVVYGLVGGVLAVLGRAGRPRPIPGSWLHVLFWSGLRGAVAVALALSLPIGFPDRARVEAITFGIVLFTLVVQGTTAELVVRRSGANLVAAQARPGEPATL